MSQNVNTKRIVKNSALLYVRMLFTMWLNLYATRLVLANLGVNDMGVYGVVGSIVGLFAVFSSGIVNTVQRFITYELGYEQEETNKVFCSSLNIIIILSFFILILLETVGLWFLYHKVEIPSDSINQAFWVYQFSVFTCIVNLISIPYNALVIAHEKMDVYAIISVLQVVLTCISAWCLSLFGSNRLFFYAALMALISIIIRFLYQVYCYKKFQESRYHLVIDIACMKQIGKFAGVTTISGILETIYNQGVIIVINWSFGVALNAVYTIALQLKNSVLSFSFNILKAVSPQITKTYANGDYETHKKLVYIGSKMEILLIFFILIPFFFRTHYIMSLWLGNLPDSMASFAKVAVVISLIYALLEPIRTSVLATNRIERFLIYPNIVYLLLLPPTYLISTFFNVPSVLMLCILMIEIIVCVVRIYYSVKVSPIDFKGIFVEIISPCSLVLFTDVFFCYFFSLLWGESLLELLILLSVNSIALLIIISILGLTKNERSIISNGVKKMINVHKR